MDLGTITQLTGSTTWLELYEFLDSHNLIEAGDDVKMSVKDPKPVTATVSVQEVKARAFEEIYKRLPDRVAVFDIQRDISNKLVGSPESIFTFLDNLPVKKAK